MNLRIFANAPEHRSDDEGRHEGEEVTDAIVIGATPVCQLRLPQAGSDLCPERLRVFCWKT